MLQRGEAVGLDQLELRREDLIELRLLMGDSGKFLRGSLKINMVSGSSPRRKAKLAVKKKKMAEGRPSFRIYWPEGGVWRKKPIDKLAPISQRRFYGSAILKSRTRSGTLQARLVDPEPLISLQTTGTVQGSPSTLMAWGKGMSTNQWLELTLDPTRLPTDVFLGAYTGDIADLTFVSAKTVYTNAGCLYPASGLQLPLQPGSNLVIEIQMPQRLQQMMPTKLLLFGPFQNQRVTGNVQLRSAPQFNIKAGHVPIQSAFLAIHTVFSLDGGWETLASINGIVNLFDKPLPISSDLPIEGGIASFNLETAKCPPRTDLSELVVIANGADLFSRLGPLPKLISQWRLKRLNLIYDGTAGTLITLSMRILSGNSLALQSNTVLAAEVNPFTLDWQVGMPEADKIVTVDGKGKGRIATAGDVVWKVAILTEPEFCVQFWADKAVFSSQQAQKFLSGVGETNAVNVANYSGCMVSYFLNRTEIHIGDDGQDFPKVYPKG